MKYTSDQISTAALGVRIVKDYPPNIANIEKVFPGIYERAMTAHVFFTYGDTIYNPSGVVIERQLLAHEAVHVLQQREWNPEDWWKAYLKDKDFRFQQELEAHQVEYSIYVQMGNSRPFRRRYLTAISERLAGSLYGHLLKKREAKALIVEGADNG